MTRESLTLETFGSSSWMQISWHSTNSPCNLLELLEVWMRPQRIPTKDHPLPVGRPILSRHSDRQTDGRAVIPRWTKDAQIAFRFALQHAHSLHFSPINISSPPHVPSFCFSSLLLLLTNPVLFMVLYVPVLLYDWRPTPYIHISNEAGVISLFWSSGL